MAVHFQTTRGCACWVNRTVSSTTVYAFCNFYFTHCCTRSCQRLKWSFNNFETIPLYVFALYWWSRPAYRILRVQVGTLRAHESWHLFESTRNYALCSRDAIMNKWTYYNNFFSLSIVAWAREADSRHSMAKSFHLLICFHPNRAVRVLVRTHKFINDEVKFAYVHRTFEPNRFGVDLGFGWRDRTVDEAINQPELDKNTKMHGTHKTDVYWVWAIAG